MPNDHAAVHTLSVSGEFQARFAAALCAYVPGIFTEDPVAVPYHTERLTTANKVLNAPRAYAERLSLGAAAALVAQIGPVPPGTTYLSVITDVMLDALVAQWWTALAIAPPVT